MVVQGKVVRRNMVDPGVLLQHPVAQAQRARGLLQFGFRGFAPPERFNGFLQFTLYANTGKPEG